MLILFIKQIQHPPVPYSEIQALPIDNFVLVALVIGLVIGAVIIYRRFNTGV